MKKICAEIGKAAKRMMHVVIKHPIRLFVLEDFGWWSAYISALFIGQTLGV